jgi:hypothetical protein
MGGMATTRFNLKLGAYKSVIQFANRELNRIVAPEETLALYLTKMARSEAPYSADLVKDVQRFVRKAFVGEGDFQEEGKRSEMGLICLRYLAFNCASAVEDALKIMNSRTILDRYYNSTFVSTPELIEEVFTNPVYGRVLAAVALKMMIAARGLEAENGQPGFYGHVDDWLVQEFLARGYSFVQAKNMMMKVMGLYATRGANGNVFEGFARKENAHVYVSLLVFSSAMSLLDAANTSDDSLFSLPANVHTSCQYGNPYHFWMAAYISHALRERGYGSWDSFIAAHLLSVGYQMFSNNVGRDMFRFMSEPNDSPFMNYMRSTVIFNDAGALWGLNVEKERSSWSLDLRHNVVLKAYIPRKFEESDDEEFEKNPVKHYLAWTGLISHDLLFTWIRGYPGWIRSSDTDLEFERAAQAYDPSWAR